jgi:serine/threonine-protein kinase
VRPFHSSSLSNVLYKILHEDPPPPISVNPACSPELDRLITRSIAKDPDDHPERGRVHDALRAIAATEIAEGEPARITTGTATRHRMDSATPPVSGDPPPGIACPPPTRPAHARRASARRRRRSAAPPPPGHLLMLLALTVSAAEPLLFRGCSARVGARAAPWCRHRRHRDPAPRPTATPSVPTPSLVTVQIVVDPPARCASTAIR